MPEGTGLACAGTGSAPFHRYEQDYNHRGAALLGGAHDGLGREFFEIK